MAKSTSTKLVIVESPAKAATIEKFLGKGYKVVSSFGHIRDLPKGKMGIETDGNFEPNYIVPKDKAHVAKELKSEAKKASEVILASDEDREGEAIAWHISELLDLKPSETKRIVFHEITEPAIKEAIDNPRSIDTKLVDAQQARRVLDRLVGYELSPLLWRKIRRGLSAGRVQSVSVRLIAEREEEIKSHSESKSFKISANLKHGGSELDAKALEEKADEKTAHKSLEKIAKSKLEVLSVESSPQQRKAPPPFTTSSLQQAASTQLRLSVRQTMMLAQRLYESGHITYMRTDSTNLSQTAKGQIRSYILKEHGEKYIGGSAHYKTVKGAQEAHEAIRPTNVNKFEAGKDAKQKRLYELIRKRAVASMMAPAQLQKTDVKIDADEILVASGVKITFDGFLAETGKKAVKETVMPKSIKVGDKLELVEAIAEEKMKKAPARYSEASLVKQLEKLGIGRPSTYAPTISTIQDRGYVVKEDVEGEDVELIKLTVGPKAKVEKEVLNEKYGAERSKLSPTDTGMLVNKFLVNHFSDVMNYDFTAEVEAKFDEIAEGKHRWQEMIGDFYKPFHKLIGKVEKSVSKKDTGGVIELGTDPATKLKVYARLGRFGPMIQLGETGDEENEPKFAPFPKGKKLEEATLEDALTMLALPRKVGETIEGEEIEATIGRYGPYIRAGKVFVSISDEEVFTIDETGARKALLENKKKKQKASIKKFEKEGIEVKTGRFGPYVTDGKLNASISKKIDPEKITLKEAQELLEKKAAKKK